MTKEQLRDYLGIVLAAEKDALALKTSVNKLQRDIQAYGTPQLISKPVAKSLTGGGLVSLFFTLVGLALPLRLLVEIRRNREFSALGIHHLVTPISTELIVLAVVGAFLFTICFILFLFSLAKTKRANREAKKHYRQAVEQDQARVRHELSIKGEVIRQCSILQAQYADAQQVLEKIYSLDVVHPNFRNIVAAASFYQYIDTGMCSSLEGHEGAYTLFLHESWYGKLCARLDSIVDMLGQIHQNQYVLYEASSYANKKIERLTRMQEIATRNSEIIAYNTERTARNTEYLKWMGFFRNL